MSRQPAWYKLYLIRRIKKLEEALYLLNHAECCINHGYNALARYWLRIAKITIR